MKLNLRYKIVTANLIVLFLTFLVISVVIVEGLNTTNRRMVVQNLIHQADISIISIKQSLLTDDALASKEDEFKARSKDFSLKLSAETGMRVLVFSNTGELTADSEDTGLTIQEFKELTYVLDGNRTYVIRKSGGSRYLYFTFPVMQMKSILGEVMFIYPMDIIDKSAGATTLLLLAAFIIGALIILTVSIPLSLKITKPIKKLKESSREIANGNFKSKINMKSSDEVGELAKAFNNMADEIENRINLINVEKSKLNSILESMGEGVIALDGADETIAINSKAKSVIDCGVETEIRKVTSKVRQNRTRTIIEISSGSRNLLVCATPLILRDNENGVVLVLNDITELRLLQEKQRQFVTNVSHELKTPLTTIMGYIELLKEKGTEKDVFETSVRYLESASDRLQRLVNDLIDLSSLSKFEFEIEPKSTNISSLVRDIAGQMALKAQKFNISINTNISGTPDILADPVRIKQAVVNILDNAIKYSSGGKIDIALSEEDNNICLVISDNGCGIPSGMDEKIFEPFFRVDKARSRNLGGNGLGLSITREIVEKHNGTIVLKSREGEGTRVQITLPKQSAVSA